MKKAYSLLVLSFLSFNLIAQNCDLLCNGDFDDVIVTPPGSLAFVTHAQMPCWYTTSPDSLFEVWGTGFNGVSAYSGQQFIEMNGYYYATLYQSFVALPASNIAVGFAHRGRSGIDTVGVEIGPAGGPYTSLGNYGDGTTAWVYRTLNYTLPNTGSNFTVRFISVYSAFGSGGVGNFLDAVSVDYDMSLDLGNDTIICLGDSMILDAGAGFGSYLWSNNSTSQTITVNAQGSYSVQVTSGVCSATDTVVISTQPCTNLSIAIASTDTLFCEKQCIDFFDLTTNNPVSWQWHFQGATPDTSTLQNPTNICYNSYGSFDVTLIACNNFGCDSVTYSNFIKEFINPNDSIYISNDTLYSMPAYIYQWYETTSGLIAGAVSQYYVISQPGSYYCVVSDSIGCVASSNTIVITSASEIALSKDFSITPNPVSEQLSISINNNYNNKIAIEILNTIGEVLYKSAIINSNKTTIDIRYLPDGVYLIKFQTENSSIVRKFIKH